MYDAAPDPYCYAGTMVLKNIPGFRDEALLSAFETVSTTQRADEPLPHGRLSVSHYCAIHHHLFQDVYRWAGRFRTVRLSKLDSMFCYPENIRTAMRRLFLDLRRQRHLINLSTKIFAATGGHFLAELNAIHPFREGNGRCQMTFMTLLAQRAGHPFDLDRLDPERFIAAMIRSFAGSETRLADELRRLL